jgi:hypothetical protein
MRVQPVDRGLTEHPALLIVCRPMFISLLHNMVMANQHRERKTVAEEPKRLTVPSTFDVGMVIMYRRSLVFAAERVRALVERLMFSGRPGKTGRKSSAS